MNGDGKQQRALAKVAEALEAAMKASAENALGAMADCERVLKRIVRRAETAKPWERLEILQREGPTVEFSGRLLAENVDRTRGAQVLEIRREIWETQDGALVAVSSSTLPGEPDSEECRVAVIERSEDVQAMRFAVMDFFEWRDRARSMARKLGWSLRVDPGDTSCH